MWLDEQKFLKTLKKCKHLAQGCSHLFLKRKHTANPVFATFSWVLFKITSIQGKDMHDKSIM